MLNPASDSRRVLNATPDVARLMAACRLPGFAYQSFGNGAVRFAPPTSEPPEALEATAQAPAALSEPPMKATAPSPPSWIWTAPAVAATAMPGDTVHLSLIQAALNASGTLHTMPAARATTSADRPKASTLGPLPGVAATSFPLVLAALDATAGSPRRAADRDTPPRPALPMPASGDGAPALLSAALAAARSGS